MWASYGTNSYPVWWWADINRECPTFFQYVRCKDTRVRGKQFSKNIRRGEISMHKIQENGELKGIWRRAQFLWTWWSSCLPRRSLKILALWADHSFNRVYDNLWWSQSAYWYSIVCKECRVIYIKRCPFTNWSFIGTIGSTICVNMMAFVYSLCKELLSSQKVIENDEINLPIDILLFVYLKKKKRSYMRSNCFDGGPMKFLLSSPADQSSIML